MVYTDTENSSERYELRRQFLEWSCNGCSKAPLMDYADNLIYQDLPDQDTYFTDSIERIYLDMRDSKGYTNELVKLKINYKDLILKLEFKNIVVDKLCLRMWAYSQGEYLYVLSNREISMK